MTRKTDLLLQTLCLAAILCLGFACNSPEPMRTAEDDASWEAALVEQREDKDEEFRTSRTSPMAGTQYLKSEPADEVFLTREGRTFGLEYEPGEQASLHMTRSAGAWHWIAGEDGVECRVDDAVVEVGSALEAYATFAIGGLDLSFYPAEDRVTFIVFDPERAEMTTFEQLFYFPPDRAYAVEASLHELTEPEVVEMPTSRNLMKTFYRFARLRFRLEGEENELTAFKYDLDGDASSVLFIPFKDATSGRETYGAGRFLEIEAPEGDRFTVDFNESFNPLCNYSPAYNCAIPPRENHLAVAIRAGEKTYPH